MFRSVDLRQFQVSGPQIKTCATANRSTNIHHCEYLDAAMIILGDEHGFYSYNAWKFDTHVVLGMVTVVRVKYASRQYTFGIINIFSFLGGVFSLRNAKGRTLPSPV